MGEKRGPKPPSRSRRAAKHKSARERLDHLSGAAGPERIPAGRKKAGLEGKRILPSQARRPSRAGGQMKEIRIRTEIGREAPSWEGDRAAQ